MSDCTTQTQLPPLRDPDEIARTSARLKAIAHPVRLRMLELIARAGGDLCVCHFEDHFDVSQPTISHHLKVLRDADLISSWNVGTWVHHRVEPDVLASLGSTLSSIAGNSELNKK
jgi:ArsR family transcriptional regulator, arsenate/arsenite/antimonite-responsive transcriptional repressor